MTRGSYPFLARTLLLTALCVTLYMALQPHPPKLPIDSWGDKFEHSLAFVTLTILSVASFPTAKLFRVGERLSFLGALIEVVQSIPALHRDCDIFDWLTDTAAIATVLIVVSLWRLVRQDRRGESKFIARMRSAIADCARPKVASQDNS
jgi:hypothetical protein